MKHNEIRMLDMRAEYVGGVSNDLVHVEWQNRGTKSHPTITLYVSVNGLTVLRVENIAPNNFEVTTP